MYPDEAGSFVSKDSRRVDMVADVVIIKYEVELMCLEEERWRVKSPSVCQRGTPTGQTSLIKRWTDLTSIAQHHRI